MLQKLLDAIRVCDTVPATTKEGGVVTAEIIELARIGRKSPSGTHVEVRESGVGGSVLLGHEQARSYLLERGYRRMLDRPSVWVR